MITSLINTIDSIALSVPQCLHIVAVTFAMTSKLSRSTSAYCICILSVCTSVDMS